MKHDRNGRTEPNSQEATAILSRYRGSGLGLKRFAEEAGIPAGRLHYWLYQKHRPGVRRRLLPPAPPMAAPLFQEVKLAGRLPSCAGWAIEIGLPNGVVGRFDAVLSPERIGQIVRALQPPC
jgi:hypothetical protein